MKKFLKIYAAVLLLLFVGIPQAYAEIESKFINADIDDAKIGELYYELNTKTHKAAVVSKVDKSIPSTVLPFTTSLPHDVNVIAATNASAR